MECNICHRLMVSIYITDTTSNHIKRPIGKICPKCGIVDAPTPFFQKLKQRITKKEDNEKEKKGYHERPKFQRTSIPQCSKCKSKKFDKKIVSKPSWTQYPNSDGSPNFQLNNPNIEFTCKKCKTFFKVSLPMPFPLPKKYRKPPKLT